MADSYNVDNKKPRGTTANPMVNVFVFAVVVVAIVVGLTFDNKPHETNSYDTYASWGRVKSPPGTGESLKATFGVAQGTGAVKFDDRQLMSLLGFAMADSYNNVDNKKPNFAKPYFKCAKSVLEVVKQGREDVGDPTNEYCDADGQNCAKTGSVWYTVYRVKAGVHTGKTILGIMGTSEKTGNQALGLSIQAAQDMAMVLAGPPIRFAIQAARNVFQAETPNYVSGHSLGGFLAEAAFSFHPVEKGASFGAPGAWSPKPAKSLLNADESTFKGKPFNVVINIHETVATTIGPSWGSQFGHIAPPSETIWPEFGYGWNPSSAHSKEGYAKAKEGWMGIHGDGGNAIHAYGLWGDEAQYADGHLQDDSRRLTRRQYASITSPASHEFSRVLSGKGPAPAPAPSCAAME